MVDTLSSFPRHLQDVRIKVFILLVEFVPAFFGWGDQDFLHRIHESSKHDRGYHDDGQGRRHHEIEVFLRVATITCFFGSFAIWTNLDFQDEGKRDGSSDHATVADEQEFAELDGFPSAAEPKRVESSKDPDKPEYHDDTQLGKDEGEAPPRRDYFIKRNSDIRINRRLECVPQERHSDGGGRLPLRGEVVEGVVAVDNATGE